MAIFLVAHDKRGISAKQLSKDIGVSYFTAWLMSISSYAEGNEYARWGYNRDLEPLPQINLAMVFGQNSGSPGYYRRLPGAISDVATLTRQENHSVRASGKRRSQEIRRFFLHHDDQKDGCDGSA
jgi:hypothetical protein